MTDWDLEPTPSKDGATPGKPQEGAAADGLSDAAARPNDGARPSAAETPKAFSGAIIAPAKTVGAAASPAGRHRTGRRAWSWIAAGLVLVLAGALVGFFIARSQMDQAEVDLAQAREELGLVKQALAQSEERNWNYYRENLALEAALEQAQAGGLPSTSTTEEAGGGHMSEPFAHFPQVYGDGVFLVGEQIAPGAYDGVVVGGQGYWARLKGTDGLVSQIIANGVPRGPFVLTILESDRAVELRGVELTPR